MLLVIGGFLGCDRDSRLHGKWVFDREYTEAHGSAAPEPIPSAEKNPLGAMKEQLAGMIVPQLIEKLDGSTMTVTSKEMVFVLKNGTGKAETYAIIDRPAKDHWQVKTSEGKVESYFREGDRLGSPASGDVHLNVYWKPAGK
jgi:hypothetical protein